MKELEAYNNLPNHNRVELNVKKQQEVEYVLSGVIMPQKGQKVFEINRETGAVQEAKYKSNTVVFNFNAKIEPQKLITNPDCVYIPAMNADNAKKKFLKNSSQSFYYKKNAVMDIADMIQPRPVFKSIKK